ncbi:MAG: hypothetical protein ROW48_05980 [Bellilinea sp.]|jgi:predicted ribosomally synthesized peptide with SipW-like signal peptide
MNKRLPFGLLAILLIVLLAGIGVAYGLWSETLTIDGTVNTGEVNVEFVSQPVVYEGVQIGEGPVGPEPPLKASAASCTADIKGAGADGETLVITTTDAYPSWHCFVYFKVKSTGSVPVHVYKPVGVASNPEWANVECAAKPFKLPFPIFGASDEVAAEQDLVSSCAADAATCVPSWWQLHKGNVLYCKLLIHFTNDDKVDENSTYTFKYTIEARQWNEPRTVSAP